MDVPTTSAGTSTGTKGTGVAAPAKPKKQRASTSTKNRARSPSPYRSTAETHPEEFMQDFWNHTLKIAENHEDDFKHQALPLARIKKVAKMDPDVQMISSEVTVLFEKACQIFIQELTARAHMVSIESKRRTISRTDVAQAVSKSDTFDFLIDIVPREERNAAQTTTTTTTATSGGGGGGSSTTSSTTAAANANNGGGGQRAHVTRSSINVPFNHHAHLDDVAKVPPLPMMERPEEGEAAAADIADEDDDEDDDDRDDEPWQQQPGENEPIDDTTTTTRRGRPARTRKISEKARQSVEDGQYDVGSVGGSGELTMGTTTKTSRTKRARIDREGTTPGGAASLLDARDDDRHMDEQGGEVANRSRSGIKVDNGTMEEDLTTRRTTNVTTTSSAPRDLDPTTTTTRAGRADGDSFDDDGDEEEEDEDEVETDGAFEGWDGLELGFR